MIFFSEISIRSLIIHSVGNKLKGDSTILSDSSVVLGNDIEEVLLDFMVKPFTKSNEYYNFNNIEANPVYKSIKTIFDMPSVFVTESKKIAKYLYDEMNNPKAPGGNLFVVHFKDCGVGDKLIDGIGIFKADIADTYLKIKPSNERFAVGKRGRYQYI